MKNERVINSGGKTVSELFFNLAVYTLYTQLCMHRQKNMNTEYENQLQYTNGVLKKMNEQIK